MRTYDDLTPLWRSTIGFDRLFDLVDAAQHPSSDENYPPCNVERLSDDQYQISLALAGFSPDEVAITAEQNVLTVEGRKADKEQRQYLYQGIPARPFKRQFNLAEYVEVKGARFDNGLLQVELVREIPRSTLRAHLTLSSLSRERHKSLTRLP
jgi:molecular chaperone IbpA